MIQSMGIIEVIGLPTAITVADTMVKTANVEILNLENTKGLGYISIKISGNVAAVKTAINAGKTFAISFDKYVSSIVLARPALVTDEVFGKQDETEEKVEIKEVVEESSVEIDAEKVAQNETFEDEISETIEKVVIEEIVIPEIKEKKLEEIEKIEEPKDVEDIAVSELETVTKDEKVIPIEEPKLIEEKLDLTPKKKVTKSTKTKKETKKTTKKKKA